MTRRSLLIAFSVAHFAHHVTNSLLSALLPFISAAFGLSYTSAGFLVGSYSIASGLTNAPLGVLADRIGARRVIVWGLVLIGLSSIAIGLSTEYWQLIAFLAVMGIASGTYHAPASALIAELFSSRRGMAMGTHTTAGHLSFFAAPLVAGILATAGSWRTPYIAFVVMGVIATGLLVGNAALSHRPDNVFWMIFKLSGVCFLVSYLMVFPAFVILRRRRAEQPRPYRMPGGPLVAWTSATFCWAFIAGATLLFFKPAPTAEDPAGAVRESWLLVGETLATLAVGLLLMPKRARGPGTPAPGTPRGRPSA